MAKKIVFDLSDGRVIADCFNLFNETKTMADKRVENVAKKLLLVQQTAPQSPSIIGPDTAKLFQYNLKKPQKHDLVYVLGNGSKYNNLEIKISITSMLKFCSHWIGNIYIVGENSGINNPKVSHIASPDITKTNKDANIIHKLLVAINKIPSLTENFLFCSDDILVTKKSDWEDFVPRILFEYKQNEQARRMLYNESRNNEWDKLLLGTLDRFIGCRDHIYFYEPHIFAPINKRYFKQMCKQIDYTNSRNVIIMSLWFNWLNLKDPPKRFDHMSVFSSTIPNLNNVDRHLTYNDKAFDVKWFRDWLINRVTMEQFKTQ